MGYQYNGHDLSKTPVVQSDSMGQVVKHFLFAHEHRFMCIAIASSLDDALDTAMDADLLDAIVLDGETVQRYDLDGWEYSYAGNYGIPCDLTHVHITELDHPGDDYMLARDLVSEFESHYPDRYGIDEYGLVRSPGKFEGGAWWVAIVWGYLNDGFQNAEELEFYDQSVGYLFTDRVLLDAIVLAHNQLFPDWDIEKIDRILLHEGESGFVSDISKEMTPA